MEINAEPNTKRHSTRQRKQSKDFSDKLQIPNKNYKTIDNKFLYFKRLLIGSGSFGKVLYGLNVDRNKEFACKFEKSTVKRTVLALELNMYRELKGGVGIPNIY